MAAVFGDPVSSVADALNGLWMLISKAIPSDAQRMARLQMRAPRIHQRLVNRMLRDAERFLKNNPGATYDDYAQAQGWDTAMTALLKDCVTKKST